ncbi:MAG: hypothetical protein AB7I27_19105 [Bacteriovoracaceae bacterium]
MKRLIVGLSLVTSLSSIASSNLLVIEATDYRGVKSRGNVSCELDANQVCNMIDNKYTYARNIECANIEVNKKSLEKIGQNIRYAVNLISLGLLDDCNSNRSHKPACNSSSTLNVIFERPYFFKAFNGKIGTSYGAAEGEMINLVKSIDCE